MKNLLKTKNLFKTMGLVACVLATPAFAQKTPGVTATEIKLGNTNPYSGPASPYGTIGKTINAYFNKMNAEGSVAGRKIKFISYDDSYSPPKAVEQTQKLVESDEVLFVFQPLGTANNSAIMKYMNENKVPQLFVATGATKFGDHANFPWTMGWQPSYQTEARIYADYVMAQKADAKIAILYQNDDYGKDLLNSFKARLGAKANQIVGELPYEVTDPTVDSQIVKLQASGANVFLNFATPKHAAQAIKKMGEMSWKPDIRILNNVAQSVGGVLRPAGLDHSTGWVTTGYLKDPTDPAFKDDKGLEEFREFMTKFYPEGDKTSSFNVYGYAVAQTVMQVLKQSGTDLSRANIMKQASSLKDYTNNVMLDGIKINTSATDYYPIEQMQLMNFDGKSWSYFGKLLSGN